MLHDLWTVFTNIWPWLAAIGSVLVLLMIAEGIEEAPEDDPLSASRGCVFVLVFMVLVVSTLIGFARMVL